jgi:plasmid stabilization system protein ParE
MVVNGWAIVVKPSFLKQLKVIRDYIAEKYSPEDAKKFVLACGDFIIEKIPYFPEGFPEYKWRKSKGKKYRRAIFRKKYFIVFQVLPGKITILAIYYARRDPKNISI